MNPIRKLTALLDKSVTNTGTVVARRGASVSVSTGKGLISVTIEDLHTYAVGDTVMVKDGAIVGKVTRRDKLPVFYV